MIEIKVHVVRDVEIEVAIIVVVAEGGAGPPAPQIANTRFSGYVRERAVVVVVIKHGPIEISYVEIFPAVVVILACGRPKSPAAVVDSRLGRYIGEGAVVIVTVKLAGMTFSRSQIFERGSIHEEDVHPAVIVVVENRNTAAHGFHNVALFRTATDEGEVDASGRGYIRERYWARMRAPIAGLRVRSNMISSGLRPIRSLRGLGQCTRRET